MRGSRRIVALGELARRATFRLADRAKGSPFDRHLCELDHAQSLSAEELKEWQQQKLCALLRHARDTTRFYRSLIPRRFTSMDSWEILSELPIVRKETMKEDRDAFLSTAFPLSRLYGGYTSGTTGRRFAYWMSQTRRQRILAELAYFGGWAGFEIGARHMFLRTTMPESSRNFLQLWPKNQILIPVSRLNEERLHAALERLIDSHAKVLFGYPWTLQVLAAQAHRSRKWQARRQVALRSIVSIGGPLLHEVRANIEGAFDRPTFERYSALEVGTIAGECEMRRLHMNVGSLIAEFLPRKNGEISAEGEPSNLVLTDLFNYGMPFLRYDIEDVVAPESGLCACGRQSPLLRTVHGRAMDQIVSPHGEWIDPICFGNLVRDMSPIRQFQFVQETPDNYQVRVIPEDTLSPSTTSEIVLRCERILGPGARIQITQVDEIPALPSGKRPFIVSNLRR